MTFEVKDEDGNVLQEFESQEAFNATLENAKKVDEYATKIADLEQNANPNWKEAREKLDALEKYKAKFGDLEAPAPAPAPAPEAFAMTKEEIEKTATAAAFNVSINNRKEELLSQIADKDERVLAAHYFDKLSTGEEMDLSKVGTIMQKARIVANPNYAATPAAKVNHYGETPNLRVEGQETTESARAIGGQFKISEEELNKGGDISSLLLN